MAKMRYGDWLAEVKFIVRQEMTLEPDEISQYDEESAHDYFVDGYTPKKYVREVLIEAKEPEDSDFDPDVEL